MTRGRSLGVTPSRPIGVTVLTVHTLRCDMRNMTVSATLLVMLVIPASAGAQNGGAATGSAADSACSYHECALGIVPTWDGLAVVRGSSGPRVANLPAAGKAAGRDSIRGL